MDVKRTTSYSPPVVLTQRPKLSVDSSEIRRTGGSDAVQTSSVGAGRAPLIADPTSSRPGQPIGASSLVETGRTEAMTQHQVMLDRLKAEISSGTYKPDWDVVAQRLGEALEAA